MARSLILDISFWQSNPDTPKVVDFNVMKESGVSGVIFRLGQNTWEDVDFEEYWKNSENKGLLRGGYWYYDNRISPEIQAEKCASIVKKHGVEFDLPLFADFEDRSAGYPYKGWNFWYRFLNRLELLLPETKLGVYSGYYYFLENEPLLQSQRDYFGKYPLWIAQYPYQSFMSSEYYKEPFIPTRTWKSWFLWQVSDRGNGYFHGVESSRVDVNFYNGTTEELFGLYGDGVGTPPPVETPKSELILTYENKKISYTKGV